MLCDRHMKIYLRRPQSARPTGAKVVGQENGNPNRLPGGLVPPEAKASSVTLAEDPDSPTAQGRRGHFLLCGCFIARRPWLPMGRAHRGAYAQFQQGLFSLIHGLHGK